MENKPQNVFDKLDKQGEKIEDISKKIEGISVKDLYALAKRTWDYEDYETAQKYYNHISLLQPLDWEAPLYASLCNVYGGKHDFGYWVDKILSMQVIFKATIDYILNMDIEESRKENELSRCLTIIKENMESSKRFSLRYKTEFLKENDGYFLDFQNSLYDLFITYNDSSYQIFNDFCISVLDILVEIINSTKQISTKISKEVYDNHLIKVHTQMLYKYEELIGYQSTSNLSNKEKIEIQLNGTLYYEYYDKVISRRVFIKGLILSITILFFSILGIILSFGFDYRYYALFYGIPLLTGIYLFIKYVKERERIKLSSVFCFERKKVRLSSKGDIVFDDSANFLRYILMVLNLINSASMILSFIYYDEMQGLIMGFLPAIFGYFDFLYLILSRKYISKRKGKYLYFYKGNYYSFN